MTNCFEIPELGALVFDFNWRKRLGALGFEVSVKVDDLTPKLESVAVKLYKLCILENEEGHSFYRNVLQI